MKFTFLLFFFFNFILLFYFIRLSNFLAVGNGTAFNFPRDGELVETIPGRGGGGGERLKFCSFDLRHLPLTRRETDQKWDVVRWGVFCMPMGWLAARGLYGRSWGASRGAVQVILLEDFSGK